MIPDSALPGPIARSFLVSALQILLWPVFSPSQWRASMAALQLAPGFALLDLSIRRRDHRHLAVQFWTIWTLILGICILCSKDPMGRILGGVSESGIFLFGIVGVLGVGVSVPASMAALVAWLLVGFSIAATPWKDTPGATAICAATVLFGLVAGGLRYRRDVTVIWRLVTLLLAPPFATLMLVPACLIVTVVYAFVVSGVAVLGAGNAGAAFAKVPAGFTEAISFVAGFIEFLLMGTTVYSFTIAAGLTLIEIARRLFLSTNAR